MRVRRNFSWDSGARAGFARLQEKGSVRRGITPEINAVSVGLIVIWYRVRTPRPRHPRARTS
jgi:hypothetical protein